MLRSGLCGVLNRARTGSLAALQKVPSRQPGTTLPRGRKGSAHVAFYRPPASGAGPRHGFELKASAELSLLGSQFTTESDDRVARREGSKSYTDPRATTPPQRPSWQYLVALCSIGIVICYADRSNISTAILPMAEHFGWDRAFQGVVLSSFFAGYACTQVIGGNLADKLGGKLILAAGVALWSLFTFLTPMAAAGGTVTLIACRIMLGVGEGVAFPAVHSLIARCVPTAQQSTAVGIVTAASYMGTALAFGISPHLIGQYGWQTVFYIFGGSALLWLPFWLPFPAEELDGANDKAPGAAKPAAAAASPAATGSSTSHGSTLESFLSPAFLAMLRRKEVWAICLTQYCQSWGMYGLLTWLPTFFADQYGVQLSDLGSYTLLPYVVQGVVGAASGVLADRMIAGGWGIRRTRVLLQVLGMLGPASCLLLAVSPAVAGAPEVASALITVGLGLSALSLGGVSASQLDIAPRHAGVIFGAGNTAATLAGFLSAPVTGLLLQATNSWLLVFGVTAVHYVVGALAFAVWAGDKPLPEDSEEGLQQASSTR